jgi:hypothetical protein
MGGLRRHDNRAKNLGRPRQYRGGGGRWSHSHRGAKSTPLQSGDPQVEFEFLRAEKGVRSARRPLANSRMDGANFSIRKISTDARSWCASSSPTSNQNPASSSSRSQQTAARLGSKLDRDRHASETIVGAASDVVWQTRPSLRS